MQTFLPYPDFAESARVLDNKRLGKQRVECLQIYRALTLENYGWKNHPAVKMWKGFEITLDIYFHSILKEWLSRGFRNSIILPDPYYGWEEILEGIPWPNWLNDDRLHSSHRSNLLRKDPIHYGKFGWKESNDLPYYWPVK